jgi:hypothetical protein
MDFSRGVQIQKRDLALLISLFESRLMSSAHVAALHFDGKKEAAKKRLQKLKGAGLLGERPRRASEPAVHFLTAKAFALLRTHGVLNKYPKLERSSLEKRARVSDLTVRHELEVMDVKAAIHSALKKTDAFSIAEFCTWPLLHEFLACSSRSSSAEVLVKPDGFIRIREKEVDGNLSEHTFFLEVDRSSETQDTLVAKAACYFDYYKSGGFAARNGAEPSDYKEYPFRVLMVFKTAERRNNTAERLLQNTPPIFTQACLTTIEEATTNPLGPIWLHPRPTARRSKARPLRQNVGRKSGAIGARPKEKCSWKVK